MKVTIVKKTEPYLWYKVGDVFEVEPFNDLYWKVLNRKRKYILKDDTDLEAKVNKPGRWKIYDETGRLYPAPRIDHFKDLKNYFLLMERELLSKGFTIIRRNSRVLSSQKEGVQYHLFADKR
jgi:hypothetical protein